MPKLSVRPRLPHSQPPGLVVPGLRLVGARPSPARGQARGRPGSRTRPARSGARPSRPLAWRRAAAQPHPQVLVPGDFLQVAGQQLGERDLVQVVVLAGRQPGLDRGGGLLGDLGKHVVGAQQRQGGGHDLAAGHLLGGQRAVVRHRDPRHGLAGIVEGELEQPGRGQPQRELTPHRVHPRPVGLLPGGQGLFVVRRLLRRRDEHPDHQLSRLDGRVVAVLQQHGPLHRALAEPLLHSVVDGPFDLILVCPFHGASDPRHCLNAPLRKPVPLRQPSGRLPRSW